MMGIVENLKQVQARIYRACIACHRDLGEIARLLATKVQPGDRRRYIEKWDLPPGTFWPEKQWAHLA